MQTMQVVPKRDGNLLGPKHVGEKSYNINACKNQPSQETYFLRNKSIFL